MVILPRMIRTVKLASIRRDWPHAVVLVARAQGIQEKDGATAADWYRTAGRLAPEDAEILNSAAWCLLIMPDEAHRDPKSALKFARKAVALTKGENHMILDTLALALFLTDHVVEAIEVQEKAVAMFPESPEYRARLKRFKEKAAKR
jgi:cytochrome c-type biogenesis protein CcmH/NrfG